MNENYYIELFKKIKKQVKSNPVAVAILQEISKDRRQQNINSSPATEKQIWFLKTHKIAFRKGITKSEASYLIDSYLKNGGNEKLNEVKKS